MIKATITDPGITVILEQQLRAAKMSWLEVNPVRDQYLFDHPFAVYEADLCDGNGAVFSAWIISGGYNGGQLPYGGIYNKENYPKDSEAIAAHVGRLVIEGHLELVKDCDGKQKRKSSKRRKV